MGSFPEMYNDLLGKAREKRRGDEVVCWDKRFPYKHFGSPSRGQLDQVKTTRTYASAVVRSWFGQMGQVFPHIIAC